MKTIKVSKETLIKIYNGMPKKVTIKNENSFLVVAADLIERLTGWYNSDYEKILKILNKTAPLKTVTLTCK